MNETMALVRFTLGKHTFFLKVLAIILGFGITTAFTAPTIFGDGSLSKSAAFIASNYKMARFV